MDNYQPNMYSQNPQEGNNGQLPYTGVPYRMPEKNDPPGGLAVASLVLGILSLVTCCLGIGAFLGLAAVILGGISLAKKQGKGLAIAGLITGGIGLVLGAVYLVYLIAVMLRFSSNPQWYYDFIREMENELYR